MENTKISWTAVRDAAGTWHPGATFNPWIGCTHVSAGCDFCYAEQLMDTRYGKVQWGEDGTRVQTRPAYWRKPLVWDREARALGIRTRVFCASLADWLEDRPELIGPRCDLIALIGATPNLDWLLLSKRVAAWEDRMGEVIENGKTVAADFAWRWLNGDAPANVWLGTSTEDQAAADQRIPLLTAIPATIHFLSAEPLLGPIDLWGARYRNPSGGLTGAVTGWGGGVDWVIVGGESGPNYRSMDLEWARSIRDECAAANAAFYMKQVGGHPHKGDDIASIPEDLRIRQSPRIINAEHTGHAE